MYCLGGVLFWCTLVPVQRGFGIPQVHDAYNNAPPQSPQSMLQKVLSNYPHGQTRYEVVGHLGALPCFAFLGEY